MFLRTRRIHLVGIGGIGMSGIAEVLLNLGYEVTGSDRKDSDVVRRLVALGARVAIGHDRALVDGAHVVVRSSAVRDDNEEVRAARENGIPVVPRAEMLAELMRMKLGVAVAGSHGKTTTTSMVAAIFAKAGLDPTVVVGGKINSMGTNAVLGRGAWMIAEADESDGSFLHLSPILSVVTNIDPEHLDHYGNVEAIEDAFVAFANRIPFYGAVAVCIDHPRVQRILPRISKRWIAYGFSAQAELRASRVEIGRGRSQFQVHRGEHLLGDIELRVPGRHNVLNALAAIAAGAEADIPFDVARDALLSFDGVQRRFTIRGEIDGVLVVDDYAHHPAEIAATLSAAREWTGRRVVAVWQPHRYSRVRALREDFARCWNDAHAVLVMDVYAAGEDPVAGLDAYALAADLRAHGHKGAHATPDADAVLAWLGRGARRGDVVLTLGAGDVTGLSQRVGDAVLGAGPPTVEVDRP
jgi:UDP-N-acetylmuramate--alanine ligase